MRTRFTSPMRVAEKRTDKEGRSATNDDNNT